MPAPAVTPALLAYDNTVVFRTFVARRSPAGYSLSNGATRLTCIAGELVEADGPRQTKQFAAESVGCGL